jgi:hypothetical protein
MTRTISLGIAALLLGLFAGCSTVESRIESDPTTFASLSPADQALVRRGGIRAGMTEAAVYLAWGKPSRTRTGYRSGKPYDAWIYTTLKSDVYPSPGYNLYGGYYGFGYYRYGWAGRGYPHGWHRGYYGIYPYDPYPVDIVTYEIPYKRVFFENGRCTGWEFYG